MTKVIYYTATSLNGYIADANNSLEWLFQVENSEADSDIEAFLNSIDVLVMGSTTYEWLVEHDDLMNNPSKWNEYYGDRPTYVFTSKQRECPEGLNIKFISGNVEDHFESINADVGDKNIWVIGGGELAGQFYDAGHLDQIIMTLAPASLSSGAPILPREIYPDKLRLSDVKRMGQFVQLTYDINK